MSSNDISTVMGPGPSVAPNRIFDPPKLMPTTDKLVWRKKVRLWAKTMRTLSKSGDPKAVSACHAMPYTLYQSIDDTYGAKLEGAIDAGLLIIDPEESDTTSPVDTIEKIIKLVAEDSITDSVRRDVTMLNEVHGFKRKDCETTTAFAHRYEGHALRFINSCNALGARQTSQSFAMILLDNAKIPSSVYIAAVSQMVARANERGQEDDDLLIVPKETTRKLDTGIDKLLGEFKKLKTESGAPPTDTEDAVLRLMMQIQKDVSKINRSRDDKETADRPNARITLDDAIHLEQLMIDRFIHALSLVFIRFLQQANARVKVSYFYLALAHMHIKGTL